MQSTNQTKTTITIKQLLSCRNTNIWSTTVQIYAYVLRTLLDRVSHILYEEPQLRSAHLHQVASFQMLSYTQWILYSTHSSSVGLYVHIINSAAVQCQNIN